MSETNTETKNDEVKGKKEANRITYLEILAGGEEGENEEDEEDEDEEDEDGEEDEEEEDEDEEEEEEDPAAPETSYVSGREQIKVAEMVKQVLRRYPTATISGERFHKSDNATEAVQERSLSVGSAKVNRTTSFKRVPGSKSRRAANKSLILL